jgi:GH25 family lysozyme M1 (1,4-beta-N-acetylmuramidase)
MTYVSPGFMPELGNRAPNHAQDVWVAAFSFARGKPPIPAGFAKSNVRAHQFSEHGTFPGVGVAVDLDVWLGDAASLRAWIEGSPSAGTGDPPTDVPPIEPALSTTEVQTLLEGLSK